MDIFKEVLEEKPWIEIVQFNIKVTSPKDNGLRVPLPPKQKKKAKGKKGKKK